MTRRCSSCLIAIATIVERGPIGSSCAADVVPTHRCNGSGRVALLLLVRCERLVGAPDDDCLHAEAELRHGLTAAFVRAGDFPQEAQAAARRLPLSRPLAERVESCGIDRGFRQGPEALRPAPLGGVAALPRDEGLRRVHLRRIRDADLFEDRSQVLAERVARFLGLPDVDDAESARAFAGCVGKDAPDGPVRH